MLIRAADRNNLQAPKFLQQIHDWLKENYDQNLWQLGPMPASQAKKAGYNRWHLLLQHSNRQLLQQILDNLLTVLIRCNDASRVRWSIDVDPIEN